MATKNLHLATIFLQLVAKRQPEDFFNFEPCDAYLGGASDWMKQANQKHYPELGSDALSVWNFFGRFLEVINFCGETSGGVVKWRMFSQTR